MYFAKPYASWQRGTNENKNGRLRSLWPKRFDIATLSDEDVHSEPDTKTSIGWQHPWKPLLVNVLHLLRDSSDA
ncbi:hypothetical protein [Desulfosediminicola sp.]|uniref:hypothetical protein n=1 Tax=Desulfosediminicola sp. TaxID=2886825 RepID=UPI003AF2BB16